MKHNTNNEAQRNETPQYEDETRAEPKVPQAVRNKINQLTAARVEVKPFEDAE